MEQNSIVTKMTDLLVLNGHSIQDAHQLINETSYAVKHQINISTTEEAKQDSVANFVKENKGFKPLETILQDLEKQPNWYQANIELHKEKQFLLSGWKVFQSLRWLSLVYMVIITAIVFLLTFFVAPHFKTVFAGFGSELPAFTQLYFSGDYVALFILFFIWLFGSIYLYTINKIKRQIKSFRFIPNRIFRVPGFKAISVTVNRCILLIKLHFLVKLISLGKSTDIALQQLDIIDEAIDSSEKKSIFEQYLFADELKIAKDFVVASLEENFDEFISTSSKTIRLLSIIGTIVLGVLVASIVIAMYLPVFIMGAVI